VSADLRVTSTPDPEPPPPDPEPDPDPPPPDPEPPPTGFDLVVNPSTFSQVSEKHHADGTPFMVGLEDGVYPSVQLGPTPLFETVAGDPKPIEFYAMNPERDRVVFDGQGAAWSYFSINDNNDLTRMWGENIKFFGVTFRNYNFAGQVYSYPGGFRDTPTTFPPFRTGSQVVGCFFEQMGRYGTKVRREDRIASSSFADIGRTGVVGGALDVVIEDCDFARIGGDQDPQDFANAESAAIKLLAGVRNIVRRCTVVDGLTPARGIWHDFCTTLPGQENLVEDCTIKNVGNYADNGNVGAFFCEISRVSYERCHAENIGYGGVTSSWRAAFACVGGNAKYRNCSVKNAQVGFSFRHNGRALDAWKDGTELPQAIDMQFCSVDLGSRSDSSEGPFAVAVDHAGDVTIDNNAYTVPASVTHPFRYLGAPKTWAEWQAIGFDLNSTMTVV
jgi:hypothetical protein